MLPFARPGWRLALSLDQRGKGLVDHEGDDHRAQRLDERERHVEPHQRVPQGFNLGVDRAVHIQDHVHGHEQRIHGIGDIVIDGHARDRHGQRACDGANQRAAARFFVVIDHACRDDEEDPQQEIGEFAHAAGGGKQHVDEVFHQAHHGAGNGAHGEGSDQGGQFRKIQLDEAGHQWHAEAEKHEDG